MKRLYFLTDNIESTEQISTDLHHAGISNWNFHVLSKDEAGLYKRHIQSANYLQKLDIVRDAERGALLGLLAAILVLVYIKTAEPFGSNLHGIAYFAIFGFITLFGAWAGGMAGLTHENQKISRYHNAIDAGNYLILIDVKNGTEEGLLSLMRDRHPEAKFDRIGSTLINPLKFVSPVA